MSAETAARGWYSRSEETRMVSRREEMQRTLCCLPSVLLGSLTDGCGRERQTAAGTKRVQVAFVAWLIDFHVVQAPRP